MESRISITERSIDDRRSLRVIVIGAGISGILAAIKLQERVRDLDLVIYDKNDGLGGTWWENRYPGCACDIPAHVYQLSWDANVEWSQFYAGRSEILKYWQRVAEKYDVVKHMKFGHKVSSATWEPGKSKWNVAIENLANGISVVDSCDVLIQAVGILNLWEWPAIPGLHDFKGSLMHSAAWDESVDLKDKTVAVIGAGSSGIQIVPNIQPTVKRLDHYVRGRTWIATPMAAQEIAKRGVDADNFRYTEEEIKNWMAHPDEYLRYRKQVEDTVQSDYDVTMKGSETQQKARAYFEALMSQRLSEKPGVLTHILPSFPPLCKRLTPGPGYLEALTQNNVDVIADGIKTVTSTGITTNDGRHREVDVIVCATGFNTSFKSGFPVIGIDGKRLFDAKDRPHTSNYLSMMVDGFPNMFMFLGAHSGLGTGNLLIIIEHVAEYCAKALEKMQTENILTIQPSKRVVDAFTQFCDLQLDRTVYSDDCQSWYKTDGRVTALWPGSSLHAIRALTNPRWEDLEYTYVDGNAMGWLGNGWSDGDRNPHADKSYYLSAKTLINQDLPAKH